MRSNIYPLAKYFAGMLFTCKISARYVNQVSKLNMNKALHTDRGSEMSFTLLFP
ncbi:MAG: hypothetical protein JWP81_5289 [Ferruginibacter sp.]|nr:hypothetical protein [Ferruginibacter sp.]